MPFWFSRTKRSRSTARKQTSTWGLYSTLELLEQRLVLSSQSFYGPAEYAPWEDGTNYDPTTLYPPGAIAIQTVFDVSTAPLFDRAPTDAKAMSYDDVYQGNLDTCTVASVLSAVARTDFPLQTGIIAITTAGSALPDLEAPAATPTGYQVKLFKKNSSGVLQPVMITVPFDNQLTTEDLQTADRNEYWPAIYQRAYLKLADELGQNYRVGQFAFETLTGISVEKFVVTNGGLTEARRLEAALNAGRATTVSSIDAPNKVIEGQYGIIKTHSYTLMGMEIPASGNLSEIYVTVRNPWGYDTALEFFDSNSNGLSLSEWELSQYGVDGWNDGLVRMPWNSFKQYFDNVTISNITGPSLNTPLKTNTPPVFSPTSVGPYTIHEGQPLTVDVNAVDPDGLGLMYSLGRGVPGTLQIQEGTWSWAPPADSVGIYAITIVAEVSAYEKTSITFQVTVTSGAPTIGSLTSSVSSIGDLGNDLITLTANNVVLPFAETVDLVEFYRDVNNNGTVDENVDYFLGYGGRSGNNFSWTGYIGGVAPGPLNVMARAGEFSFSDLHYSPAVSKALTVTLTPRVPPVATAGSNQYTITPTESVGTTDQFGVALEADAAGNLRAFTLVEYQHGTPQAAWYTYGLRSRVYDANGTAQGSWQTLYADNFASIVDAEVLPDGSFVVAWSEYIAYQNTNIKAQRFHANGTANGSVFNIVTGSAWAQNEHIEIAVDAAGNILCVYTQGGYFEEDSYAVTVAADNTVARAPWRVNVNTVSQQKHPEVAMNADGNGIIVWSDYGDEYGEGQIKGRLISNAGLSNGDEFKIADDPESADQIIDVAINASGNFVVTWPDSGQHGIMTQRFNSAGVAQGAATRANTFLGTYNYGFNSPKVSLSDSGWYVVGWSQPDYNTQDTGPTPGGGNYAQIFDPTGTKAGGEFFIHNVLPDQQWLVAAHMDGDADTTFLFNDYAGADKVVMRQFNINLTPTFPADPTWSLDENSLNGTVVGTAAATDLDTPTSLTYSIVGGNVDNAFAINSSTGQITVADEETLNFEDNSQWLLTVRVVDGGGKMALTSVSINLNDVNEVPDLLDLSYFLIEGATGGTLVGNVTIDIDQDEDDTITYSILPGDDAALFTVDAVTGQIFVASGATLDFETTPHLQFTIKLTDDQGLFETATVYVNLLNLLEPPVIVPSDDPVKFTKKGKTPASLLGGVELDETEQGANLALAGAQLVVSINRAQKKGKFFDTLTGFESVSGIGQLLSQTEVGGRTIFTIQLSNTVTIGALESYLEGLQFSTKGAGLKLTTRLLKVQLIAVGGATNNLVEKTISVSKK